jgi:hypothetical protein
VVADDIEEGGTTPEFVGVKLIWHSGGALAKRRGPGGREDHMELTGGL